MSTPDLYNVTRKCLRDLDEKIQDARDGDCSPYEALAVALVVQQFTHCVPRRTPRQRALQDAAAGAVEECEELVENY